MNKPKIGDKIYIPSALHMYRGRDDVRGGLATISEVKISRSLPKNHMNSIFIKVEEVPTTSYNWNILMTKQDGLKEMFGDQVARPDPDDRPEFNQTSADWK